MRFVSLLADLEAEFGWPPDAWRRMPWAEFQARVAELSRRREQEVEARRRAAERGEIERQRDEFRRTFGSR